MKKVYCLKCKKMVNFNVNDELKFFENEGDSFEYLGKTAFCSECNEIVYDEEVLEYNRQKVYEIYKNKNDIISKKEIEEILKKYNIGKRPLSLLLGFGEITITRYLNDYIPTRKNSKLLKKILNSSSDYYSILQMNKSNINDVAFKKSELATRKLLDIKNEDKVIDDVAKYIINEIEVTNMALQKLLYYIQMFYMAFYKKHAFNSRCNAWEHGPVFGTIYYRYKSFGKNNIIDEKPQRDIELDLKNTIDAVIKAFGCYTGIVLKNFTHKEDPWKEAITTNDKIIEKNQIKKYGEKIIKELDIKTVEEIYKYSTKMLSDYITI